MHSWPERGDKDRLCRLSIVNEMGDLRKPGERGRIRIDATSLFRGYFGDEEQNIDSVVTPDWGVLDEFGGLTVVGRVDRVVVSGGEKIDLEEVETALESFEEIEECVAFGVVDEEWGERLAVAYRSSMVEVTEVNLKTRLASRLAAYKLPKTWLEVESIPRNEAGKVRLIELRAKVERG